MIVADCRIHLNYRYRMQIQPNNQPNKLLKLFLRQLLACQGKHDPNNEPLVIVQQHQLLKNPIFDGLTQFIGRHGHLGLDTFFLLGNDPEHEPKELLF